MIWDDLSHTLRLKMVADAQTPPLLPLRLLELLPLHHLNPLVVPHKFQLLNSLLLVNDHLLSIIQLALHLHKASKMEMFLT